MLLQGQNEKGSKDEDDVINQSTFDVKFIAFSHRCTYLSYFFPKEKVILNIQDEYRVHPLNMVDNTTLERGIKIVF